MILFAHTSYNTLSCFGVYLKSPLYQTLSGFHDRKVGQVPEPVTEISEMAPTTPAPATPAPATPPKRMEMKLPVEEGFFSAKLDSFLVGGDVFCLHKGWVDMFQFLMS